MKVGLEQRKQFLLKTIKETQAKMEKRPAGLIRAAVHGNSYQYFLRKSTKEKTGTYIRKKDLRTVRLIVQREYEEKVIKSAEEELKLIGKAERLLSNGKVEDQYYKMPLGKRILVTPVVETGRQYIERMQGMEFEKLPFREGAPEYYSNLGTRVRSKSEVILSNMLIGLEIPFIYEMPLKLSSGIVVHPDFTLIDGENRRLLYWEHLGMIDDEEYLAGAIQKIRSYENSGYFLGKHLIITAESSDTPLNIRLVEKKIKEIYCT